MATPTTLDEAFTPGKQFQNYRHVVAVGTQRYQTVIRFDSTYPDQSTCRVDMWTPAGWLNVVTLASADARVQALPSGYLPDTSRNADAFCNLHYKLLTLARIITASPFSAAVG